MCMRQCMHILYYCMRQYDTLVCMYIAIRTYLVSLLVCLCIKKYSGLLSCENFFRFFAIPLVLSYVFSLPNYRLTNFLSYLFVYLFLRKWKDILDSKSLIVESRRKDILIGEMNYSIAMGQTRG